MPRQQLYEFDRDYVERLAREDPEIEQHFARYFGDLLAIKLRSRLRSAVLVEDAKQEVFTRVLTALKQKGGLETPSRLGAFVNSVCNNVLFETYRAGSRFTPLDESYDEPDRRRPSPETVLMADEERAKVQNALADLTEKDQELLKWLFFEERDKDDVCRALNVDRGYLRVLLHRAKARFRDRFTQGAFDKPIEDEVIR